MFIRVFEEFAKGALSEFLPAALGEAMVVRGVRAHCNEWKWPKAVPGYGACFAAAALLCGGWTRLRIDAGTYSME